MKSLFSGPAGSHLAVDLMSAFLDGQTTPAERTQVESHLRQCTVCSAELESLRRTVLLLHAMPRVAVPRAFTLSEAQVGIRRPSSSPAWYGGLMRGLGAVAAVALVAFVAVSLLRQPSWTPTQTVAMAPTEAPAPTVPTNQESAPVAPAAAQLPEPEPAAAAASEAGSAPEQPVPAAESLPADTPLPEPTLAPELAVKAPPTRENQATDAMPALTATEPALAAMAAKAAETPDEPAVVFGRGGGAPETTDLPPEVLTPEPTAPAVPLATALPKGVRIVYADLKALYAIDAQGGVRQLVVKDGINMPQLSPDQQWIVYRTFEENALHVWAIDWNGSGPTELLTDGQLPTEGLPEGYAERRLSDTQWVPGGHVLAVTLVAVPNPESTLVPVQELWHLDVVTGSLDFIAKLDRAYRPYYSVKGDRFAIVAYGTETEPEGAVTLYQLRDGGKRADTGKVVLQFPGGPAMAGSDGQLIWTSNDLFWIAIPEANGELQNAPMLNGLTLYRVSGGEAKAAGRADGFRIAWSPDGNRAVISRYQTETLEAVDLYVANGDGSGAELYATLKPGGFLSWAPDGSRFLFENGYEIYSGAAGRTPVRLANGVSLYDARWVDYRSFTSLHDQGTNGWWLTLRTVDGEAAGLMPLPREAMIDVVRR